MKLLDKYFKIQKELYDYFGYDDTYNYEVYPIEDNREYYWCIENDQVVFWSSIEEYNKCQYNGEYLNSIIEGYDSKTEYKKQMIFKGKDYTAIVIDTECDNNRFFAIFDNKKKVMLKEEE